MLNNIQKHNIYINIASSQTFRFNPLGAFSLVTFSPFKRVSEQTMSPDSSVNAVTGYRLDDGGSILNRGSNFSLRHSIQFGSGSHPASCLIYAGFFSKSKSCYGVNFITPCCLVLRLRSRRDMHSLPQDILVALCFIWNMDNTTVNHEHKSPFP
jgi:hypothetical protein